MHSIYSLLILCFESYYYLMYFNYFWIFLILIVLLLDSSMSNSSNTFRLPITRSLCILRSKLRISNFDQFRFMALLISAPWNNAIAGLDGFLAPDYFPFGISPSDFTPTFLLSIEGSLLIWTLDTEAGQCSKWLSEILHPFVLMNKVIGILVYCASQCKFKSTMGVGPCYFDGYMDI